MRRCLVCYFSLRPKLRSLEQQHILPLLRPINQFRLQARQSCALKSLCQPLSNWTCLMMLPRITRIEPPCASTSPSINSHLMTFFPRMWRLSHLTKATMCSPSLKKGCAGVGCTRSHTSLPRLSQPQGKIRVDSFAFMTENVPAPAGKHVLIRAKILPLQGV